MLCQKLQQLTIATVRSALRTGDNAEAIRELKRQIECKSAKSPHEYRSETCRTDMMVNSMRREARALIPLLKCEDNAEYVTTQKYADTLISHLNLKNSLQSPGKRPDQLAFYSQNGKGTNSLW